MEIIKSINAGICTLKVAGGIDRYARAALKESLVLAAQTFDVVRVDLSGVELVGSVMVNLLVELRNQSPAEAGKIRLINTPEHALTILRAFRIHDLYNVNQRERT